MSGVAKWRRALVDRMHSAEDAARKAVEDKANNDWQQHTAAADRELAEVSRELARRTPDSLVKTLLEHGATALGERAFRDERAHCERTGGPR